MTETVQKTQEKVKKMFVLSAEVVKRVEEVSSRLKISESAVVELVLRKYLGEFEREFV